MTKNLATANGPAVLVKAWETLPTTISGIEVLISPANSMNRVE